MEKPGKRRITLPANKRRDYPPGLRAAILKEPGLLGEEGSMTLTVEVHDEEGVLWGQVVELPGCFATGENLDELAEALGEAIALYQAKTQAKSTAKSQASGQRVRYRVDRMTLVDV